MYPLSTRTEKDYITKMIPFFFCSVYMLDSNPHVNICLIACLCLHVCYEKDFMFNLHKSITLDLVHLFNDTFRYLDDILSIDNTEFERTLDIYTTELQRNKTNSCQKETPLYLNIKVIGDDIHTSITTIAR